MPQLRAHESARFDAHHPRPRRNGPELETTLGVRRRTGGAEDRHRANPRSRDRPGRRRHQARRRRGFARAWNQQHVGQALVFTGLEHHVARVGEVVLTEERHGEGALGQAVERPAAVVGAEGRELHARDEDGRAEVERVRPEVLTKHAAREPAVSTQHDVSQRDVSARPGVDGLDGDEALAVGSAVTIKVGGEAHDATRHRDAREQETAFGVGAGLERRAQQGDPTFLRGDQPGATRHRVLQRSLNRPGSRGRWRAGQRQLEAPRQRERRHHRDPDVHPAHLSVVCLSPQAPSSTSSHGVRVIPCGHPPPISRRSRLSPSCSCQFASTWFRPPTLDESVSQ